MQSVVPSSAIFSAERKFYEIGIYNMPATLQRCEIEARRRRGDIPECWALDMHAMMLNVAMVNVRHQRPIAGLDQGSAERRWHIYANALGVVPADYQRVEDGTFQRVYAAIGRSAH